MSEIYINPFKDEQTYIVELPAEQLEVIAQALHLYMAATNTKLKTREAIRNLADQTHVVYDDCVYHKVYPNVIQAPEAASLSKPIYYGDLL